MVGVTEMLVGVWDIYIELRDNLVWTFLHGLDDLGWAYAQAGGELAVSWSMHTYPPILSSSFTKCFQMYCLILILIWKMLTSPFIEGETKAKRVSGSCSSWKSSHFPPQSIRDLLEPMLLLAIHHTSFTYKSSLLTPGCKPFSSVSSIPLSIHFPKVWQIAKTALFFFLISLQILTLCHMTLWLTLSF